MSSDEISAEFDRFSRDIASDPIMVLLARWRRSAFIDALRRRPDVVDVIPSGSLARGTHVGPIHDVDLIVVFDQTKHPEWRGGGSAQAALEHTQTGIRETLQSGPLSLVHDTELRNHVVKCSLDPSLGPFDLVIPGAPPVDVMPAVRAGSHLRVPERRSDRWIDVDPERLMKMVAARQREWSNFDQVVRMIKDWAEHHGLHMKSLAVEVLVLTYLPRPGLFETVSCSDAIARFFEAASRAHITRLVDPAGRCGEIDPHMNYAALRKALADSADLARKAVEAERAWENRHLSRDGVTHPSVFWQQIFGKKRFRRPRVWYWSPYFPEATPSPESRPWFDQRTERADESAWSWRLWRAEPGSHRDEPGPHRDEPGPEPDEPGPHPDRPGPHPDRPGPYPSDAGGYWGPASGGPPGGPAGPGAPAHGAPEPATLADAIRSSAQEVPITPSVFG
jgi:hypothetical protein